MEEELEIQQYKYNKEDYNNIPVFYCKECLSLLIRLSVSIDYCDFCGSTDIGVTTIDLWEELYKNKYHKTLI